MANDLTAERLRYLLNYDCATGIFTWRISRSGVRIGQVAGRLNSEGHRQISVEMKRYQAHRLAWLYVYGEWPLGDLDHKDTHKDHNWIDNLRPADDSLNQGNQKLRADNTSGLKGASYYRPTGKWMAQIVKNGKNHYLGYFDTAEEAHAAYLAKARELFGEFARAG